ncbi:hypothetical protein C8R44DRAFT_233078 [Mycena epipterygia]|nr:hypothetical protein C8R44DRAFT_233078 [Mycena epipterygia]
MIFVKALKWQESHSISVLFGMRVENRGAPPTCHPDIDTPRRILELYGTENIPEFRVETQQEHNGADIYSRWERDTSAPRSVVIPLTSARHRVRLVPLESSSFLEPVICEVGEGLYPPGVQIGCPPDMATAPHIAFHNLVSHHPAELYVISGPQFFIRTRKRTRRSTANEYSDLREIKDGYIIRLRVGDSDRTGSDQPAVLVKIEIGSQLQNELPSVHGPARSLSGLGMQDIPDTRLDTTRVSTLVQFTEVSDDSNPPTFRPVICQLIDGAAPVPIMRRSPATTAPAIICPSRKVSRRHASVWSANGQVHIVDTNSKHGTFTDGLPVAGTNTISDGNTLRIGPTDERRDERGMSIELRVFRILPSTN